MMTVFENPPEKRLFKREYDSESGKQNKSPNFPGMKWGMKPRLLDCCLKDNGDGDCEAANVCCLACFLPCNTFAATRMNNARTNMTAYDKGCRNCCGGDWWTFCATFTCSAMLSPTVVPLTVPPLVYAFCTRQQKVCTDCCCWYEWVLCFPCKATQVYKQSVTTPSSLYTAAQFTEPSSQGFKL